MRRHSFKGRSGTPRRSGTRATAVLVLSSLLLSGCYTAQPLRTPQPVPDTRVFAELTDEGAADMAPRIGPGVVAVEGFVRSASPETWELSLVRVEQRNGEEQFWNREPVAFPRAALASVQERRLSRGRSFALAAGITAAALLVANAFGDGLFSGDEPDPDPVPPN